MGAVFRRGLSDTGFIEGRNVALEAEAEKCPWRLNSVRRMSLPRSSRW